MKLSNYITKDSVMMSVKASSKDELLNIMADEIVKLPKLRDCAAVTDEMVKKGIFDREKQSSTGLGDGYAFPHARLAGLDDIVVLLGILDEPVEYESFDKKPVQIACMIIAPEENPTLALKVMSEIVRSLNESNSLKFLLESGRPDIVADFFKEKETHVEETIVARDIMRAPLVEVKADTPLKEVTRLMSKHRLGAIVITDKENKVVGEITCDILFNYGMPDFFKSLKSVSFIGDFDPFEKYFSKESKSIASDVMSKEFSVVEETATIIEIVFELTVKHRPKVYVVDADQKLVGIIDQSTVLDRIVNL